ncbi:UPF0695 membrane protein C977.11/PB8B6.06c family [Quillaja saponaria]|uniref:UPF0695 membrane protein C977.11/PB8B6.06c family n=1 Tax=Quillaja saponaria TaxID=32244 RepID=A0AAD7PRK0_QUISA|nr:UPF0695 membrane protein C977.11/PB8B6.06c family [Quillaja saponaria]KAJ7965606.1 UPF0695 membrane protein C977.11/PB8B6.06c family [Quillaja saponaria]
MEGTSSAGSSFRRHSFNLSCHMIHQIDDGAKSDSISEAGDIGDRAISRRHSQSSSIRLSCDHMSENGAVIFIPEDDRLQPNPAACNSISSVTPLPPELISPPSTDGARCSEDMKHEPCKKLPKLLEYVSCLVHLAFFGILGVLTRYLLQKLFGPEVAGVTSDQSYAYLDLPSNMVGSFLMGWFGIVFKEDISRLSNDLAIGLSTGYLGSLTTFSGWNQKMLDLSVAGHWLFCAIGFLIGMMLIASSISLGIETAKGFRWLLNRRKMFFGNGFFSSTINWTLDSCRRQLVVMMFFLLMLALLWGVSGALVKAEFNSGGSSAQLWLACMVGPLGVWVRWYLARLNGYGLGKAGLLNWIPFGTLIANVSAACVMAALAAVKKAINTKTCDTVATGIQFGLLGCLSTVSTFAAEFHARRQSMHPWRAYIYAMITICVPFGLGTLVYSVPVWTRGYEK